MVCVVGRMRDLILQLSKSSIYSTKPSESDVVLFLDKTPGRQFEVRTYICSLTTPALQHQARKMLIPALYDDCWPERSGSVFTFVSRLSQKHEEKHLMFQSVAKALEQLNEFELRHER
ncbi:TPA: hypothetical protein MIG94_27020 [Klebsiella pneumoniae]|nr:hypothetical protein [Klebsiella pneumoniae]